MDLEQVEGRNEQQEMKELIRLGVGGISGSVQLNYRVHICCW